MPVSTPPTRRPARQTEGFSTTLLRAHPDRPARTFLPADYQPKYAYPLVVVFHDSGADEDAAARLAPLLSRRNYVVACPRGPVNLGPGTAGRRGFAWPAAPDAAYLSALLAHAREKYHLHPQRLYLLGTGDGAAAAYRFAVASRGAVAGVALLSAEVPAATRCARGLRLFVGHGEGNPAVPVAAARRAARELTRAGAMVRFESYPAADRVSGDMLRDVNRWIMGTVNAGPDWLATGG
ncbi:Putative esterase OS=Singulisphaera acidiphila (strain ATCC BAA-1392 / DSM 18658 / VKM B-2454 / MOB10) GN=Sinac_0857 PE=4 SV=1: Abhydrolase_5 [Gemmataceae bacterium]|nr:Putative esterase OS=Singulisphaera acidiphila (strain ATCC BAA-1392 / DSM 18658 / VKM B-2454 / MOB10) GN=Sinac_0857 PE=4 SV=1: Abhydrolase_5 [Gemmataceae bacterium]VTU01399.1 Putative esterase OS=Singulisphaera acidiphila (strain ATCC BAA-1392 / DSM 18658 / VKM B-2454 / MOB10) GN=Sinac_0857 PE=4 SV=1: Abhydrolase_5 [Gemmataceae bacterium]